MRQQGNPANAPFTPGTLRFGPDGLLPAVAQDASTGRVLMLAYMNREALERTLRTGRAWYWSRSRGRLWMKGETSGHLQHVEAVVADCDGDALLLRVRQEGPACHTGEVSCFHHPLGGPHPGGGGVGDGGASGAGGTAGGGEVSAAGPEILAELYRVILQRRREAPEGSYTARLFRDGLDRILKKVGEEAAEVLIAAKGDDRDALAREAADLLYHLWVLLAERGLEPARVFAVLRARRGEHGRTP